MAKNEVKIVVTADTTKAKRNLEEIGSKMTDLGTRITGAFTLPVVGALMAAVTQSKQLQDAITPIKAAFAGVAAELGNALVPILAELTPTILEIAKSIKDLIVQFQALPIDQKNMIVGFVGIVAAIGPAIMIIGQMVQFIGILQVLIPSLTVSFTGLGLAIGSAAASMMLLYAAFILFKEAVNSAEFKQLKALLAGGWAQGSYAPGSEEGRQAGIKAFMESAQSDNLLAPPGSANSPRSINVFINSMLNTADQDQMQRTLQPFLNDALRQSGLR